MPTSMIIRRIAQGASSAEEQEALEAELDARLPSPGVSHIGDGRVLVSSKYPSTYRYIPEKQ